MLTVAKIPLLDIPAQAAAHGFGALELVHFHLPSIDSGYLNDLRASLADAHVSLHALLIDTGDPTNPNEQARAAELQTVSDWIDIAGNLRAETARVIAGDAHASPETLALSVRGLHPLADQAEHLGLRLTTENWHRLLDHPEDVLSLLDQMGGRLGLKVDFGNWPQGRKHADLPRIALHAESTHAKAFFSPEIGMDEADFTRCLNVCRDAGFAGTHSLIFDSPGDEWSSLEMMRAVTLPYLG